MVKKDKSYLLGISAFYHDSAAVLLCDGQIVAAAQEERFTRKKHDPGFPHNAVIYCLEAGGISISHLDAVVYYEKPFLKFERLLETYYAQSPRGLVSFNSAIPVWIKEKVFIEKLIKDNLISIDPVPRKSINLLYSDHHLSHAASAFYPSPYPEAAILTVDGVGEWSTASIGYGHSNEIDILKELRYPHSVGLLYSAFTYFLGFKVNSGEYKVMGLAPYGGADFAQVKDYIQIIKGNLVDIAEDGSIWLNQNYFNYATGLKMIRESKWEKLFGLPARKAEDELSIDYCNLAFAIQKITDEIILKMAAEARRLTGSQNLCIAGGVGLNCVANGCLVRERLFKNIWIQPASGDAGGALGAAYVIYYIQQKNLRRASGNGDDMQGAYLGPEYDNNSIPMRLRKYDPDYQYYEEIAALCEKTAELLAKGFIVGWFQGKMEWGPRALGNRSILADGRNPDMQKRLNIKIKHREGFRPFAPSVMEEDTLRYFDISCHSPYMLLIGYIHNSRRNGLPPDYLQWNWKDKLYFQRSDIPAVTHIDYSARIHTVSRKTNSLFWDLLAAFRQLTGCSVLVNTSFNVRGEPIVCTPEDAYKCFMQTDMDYLVIGNYLFEKSNQPPWKGGLGDFDLD